MQETWTYEKFKRFDNKGNRWHFVSHIVYPTDIPWEDRPFEIYFRDDQRTEFGILRFERQADNPNRDYDAMVNKIMNKKEYREKLLDPSTMEIWLKSWK